jgi:hypothetical protein
MMDLNVCSANCGIVIFKRGEIPCPDCLKEYRGYVPNPDFEKCQTLDPGKDLKCGSMWYCPACQDEGELMYCERCKGTGRIPA